MTNRTAQYLPSEPYAFFPMLTDAQAQALAPLERRAIEAVRALARAMEPYAGVDRYSAGSCKIETQTIALALLRLLQHPEMPVRATVLAAEGYLNPATDGRDPMAVPPNRLRSLLREAPMLKRAVERALMHQRAGDTAHLDGLRRAVAETFPDIGRAMGGLDRAA